MNTPPNHDKSLSKVLREWSVDARVQPRFQEEVWRRIERAEATAPPELWSVCTRWFESIMMRPTLAVSYVTALLLLGLAAGYWQAQESESQAKTDLRTLYVQSVDPYQAPRN